MRVPVVCILNLPVANAKQTPPCFLQRRCYLVLFVCLWINFTAILTSAQPAPLPITQRDINIMAASVEDARSALIDNAGLRQTGEDLNVYLRRIALPLQGETPTNYKTRIRRYLDLLSRSVEAARSRNHLPILRDAGPANRALWERTIRALQQFPGRVAHTQAAWQQVEHASKVSTNRVSTNKNVNAAHFDAELAQTVSLLIAIDDGLRDARP